MSARPGRVEEDPVGFIARRSRTQCNPARFEPPSIEETGVIDDCDFVVCPVFWGEPSNTNPNIERLAAEAKRKNKQAIVFVLADPAGPFNTAADNLAVFRSSLKKSQQRPRKFVFPRLSRRRHPEIRDSLLADC